MPRGVRRLIAAALLAPCFVAVYDAVILITSWQRLQRAAASLGESVAQAGPSQPADLPPLFAFAQAQAQPEDVMQRGAVIITGIKTGRNKWQSRAGSARIVSRFGAAGDATAVGAVDPRLGGALVATEIAAPLSPWIVGAGWLPDVLPPTLRAWSLHHAD